MSSTNSATPTLTLDVRSRRSERRFGVLALVGVAAAVMLLPIPALSAILLFVLSAGLVGVGLWRQGWLGGDRLTAVRWLSDGSWQLCSLTRKNIPATLSADSRAGAGWLWLRWHIPGARPRQRSMLILKGDVLPAELGRLNARLRLESVSSSALAGARR